MKRILRRIRSVLNGGASGGGSSAGYEIIDRAAAREGTLDGWFDASVAERQDAAYGRLLEEMRAGRSRIDFTAAADAVRAAGMDAPSILEIGCGSGYYAEVLSHLLGGPVRYTGLDYSPAMIELARRRHPGHTFAVGSATEIPFPDDAFDISINGAALMHIIDYEKAIAESRRVSSGWCIFHTVPVHRNRPTTFLRKHAYGSPTVEISFNESELTGHFSDAGLALRGTFESIPYDLVAVLGEPTVTRTYLCEVER